MSFLGCLLIVVIAGGVLATIAEEGWKGAFLPLLAIAIPVTFWGVIFGVGWGVYVLVQAVFA